MVYFLVVLSSAICFYEYYIDICHWGVHHRQCLRTDICCHRQICTHVLFLAWKFVLESVLWPINLPASVQSIARGKRPILSSPPQVQLARTPVYYYCQHRACCLPKLIQTNFYSNDWQGGLWILPGSNLPRHCYCCLLKLLRAPDTDHFASFHRIHRTRITTNHLVLLLNGRFGSWVRCQGRYDVSMSVPQMNTRGCHWISSVLN